MDVVRDFVVHPRLPEKGEEDQPPDVEGRQARRHKAHAPEEPSVSDRGREGPPENLVLAEEAGEAGSPDDGERRHEERNRGRGNLFAQAAHLAHVLLAGERVDHAARTEEEQGFEVGVGGEMKNAGAKRPYAAGHHHVAQLADRGVRQDPLDVILRQADGSREDGGERSHARDDGHGLGGQDVERVRPGDHIDSRRDHGRGVDQRADRRRTFHRVRQPDVQRKLRGFSARPHKQQERHHRNRGVSHGKGPARRLFVDGRKSQRAEYAQHREHSEDEAGVPDPVHQERLVARRRGRFPQEIEADQKVGAKPHAFPAHKQQQVVVRQHQREHGEHEQVHVPEEAVVAAFVGHVADGVNVDQKSDSRDDQDHYGRERVEQESPVGLEVRRLAVGHVEEAAGQPGVEDRFKAMLRLRGQLQDGHQREEERDSDHARTENAHRSIRESLPEQEHQERSGRRKERDHPDVFQIVHRATTSSSQFRRR